MSGARQGDAGRPRVGPEFFEELYARSEDPWGFAQRDYERRKYQHSLASLGGARFGRCLEVGCSIGVLTEQLASACKQIVAIDVSALALARARRRLRHCASVTLSQMSFPERMPEGPWDLIVCSEVLYYLDSSAFEFAIALLRREIAGGATVLAVHWRPVTRTYPFTGDQVHDRLQAELGLWHVIDDRRPEYRLDVFRGRAVP